MAGKTASGPGIDAFAHAHAHLLRDASIQFDLPRVMEPHLPGWVQQLLDALGMAAPLVRFLFWAGAIAGACVLLYLISSRLLLLSRSRRPAPPIEAEPWRPDAGPARALLREADDLARNGQFSQAAHLLLWRSIEDIGVHRPELVQPALTSRDIARAEGLPGEARKAFTQIAQAVETSLFGKRPLDARTWQMCRTAYEQFAFDKRWA